MQRTWGAIKHHPVSAGLFLLYWAIVFSLDAFGWRKPANRPEDMIKAVVELHLLLPVIAGALVGWWRRQRPGGISGGMLAGAAVLVTDATALLTYAFVAFHHYEESGGGGESIFELPVLLIAIGLLGSLLGMTGALGIAGIARLRDRWQKRPAPLERDDEANNAAAGTPARRIPGGALWLAGGLALGVAAVVSTVVIPAVRGDTFAGAAPERAATAFAVNAILNVLIGIIMLAPFSHRTAGAGKVVAVVAAFVGLLLGAALLDAASAFKAHGPAMRAVAIACLACAGGDLGAGVLTLVAVRQGRRCVEGALAGS